MQATIDCIVNSGISNGRTVSLFVLAVYIVVMPKELMYLASVFIGATGYLFFLLLQPNSVPDTWTQESHVFEMPKTIRVAVPDCTKSTLQAGAINITMPTQPAKTSESFPIQTIDALVATPVALDNKLVVPVVASKDDVMMGAPTKHEQNTFRSHVSEAEISDDESTHASSDENQEITSDESSVTETRRTAGTSAALAEDNQSDSMSINTDSSTEAESSTEITNTVCCPRFRRKKASTQQEEKENQLKGIEVRFAAFKREKNMSRQKLSSAAAPFVVRNKVSVDAIPFSCGPCVPNMAPPSSVQPNKTKSRTCWEWESRGFCPRGPDCRWEHSRIGVSQEHPQAEMFQEHTQSYETMWEHPQTEMFQEQPQNHETVNHLPTHVGVWIPSEFLGLGNQNMVQTPMPAFVDSFSELNTHKLVQTSVPQRWNAPLLDSSVLGANNSFCEDDIDVLTDDGF